MVQVILVSLGDARLPWALTGRARNGESVAGSLSQSVLSTQPVLVEVTATTEAGAAYNPTSDTVQVAFVPVSYPPSSPGSGDWARPSGSPTSAATTGRPAWSARRTAARSCRPAATPFGSRSPTTRPSRLSRGRS